MVTAVMAPAAIMAPMPTPTLTVTLMPPTLTITPPTLMTPVTLMPPTLATMVAFMPTLAITVATPTAATSPDDRRCFHATTAGKLHRSDRWREQRRGANRSRAFYVFVIFINAAIRFFS